LRAAVATSRGARHSVNEDSHSALDGAAPLFVVADGVGGGALASRASRELVARLHTTLDTAAPDPSLLRSALIEADRQIARSIARRTEASGAATVALCKGHGATLSHWLVAWVGDCRVYRVDPSREHAAQLLTVDDTYRHLDELPPRGGSMDDPARMVGNGAVDQPNVRPVALRSGDMLVLCSDGVHKHASGGDIGRLLGGDAPLAQRCAQLIEFARGCGSRDDATVLVVQRVERNALRRGRVAGIAALIALIASLVIAFARDAGGPPAVPPAAIDMNNAGRQP
jgi:PPM family protein phosphatase